MGDLTKQDFAYIIRKVFGFAAENAEIGYELRRKEGVPRCGSLTERRWWVKIFGAAVGSSLGADEPKGGSACVGFMGIRPV